MINYLTIDGKSSLEFGLIISGAGTMNSPQKRYSEVDIPGRNGKLLMNTDNFFDNVELTYNAYIYENTNILPKVIQKDWLDKRTLREKLRAFREFIGSRNGYVRIEDTYHPDEYRLGYFAGPLEVETEDHVGGMAQFALTFMCKPQRFLKDGEVPHTYTSNGIIHNNTGFTAKPIIRAYSTGTFTIDGVSIRINSASGYTDIDCDLMECYKGSTNCNGNVTLTSGAFPVLKSGDCSISMSGISKLIITPNWWTL